MNALNINTPILQMKTSTYCSYNVLNTSWRNRVRDQSIILVCLIWSRMQNLLISLKFIHKHFFPVQNMCCWKPGISRCKTLNTCLNIQWSLLTAIYKLCFSWRKKRKHLFYLHRIEFMFLCLHWLNDWQVNYSERPQEQCMLDNNNYSRKYFKLGF